MTIYRVEALEKFLVRTVYFARANSKREAVKRCRCGEVPYEHYVIEEGDDEWIRTFSIDEQSSSVDS